MGYGNCGSDSKGRGIGYAHEAQCDHLDCSKIIDRGMSYACGGEHGETEYSCEGYFCEGHLRGPLLDDDHSATDHLMGPLCFECADAVELDEKECKESERLEKHMTEPPEFDKESYITVDAAANFFKKYGRPGQMGDEDIPAPKLYEHQRDAIRHMMENPPIFSPLQGMGATNQSIHSFREKEGRTGIPAGETKGGGATGRWSHSDVAAVRNRPTGVIPKMSFREKGGRTGLPTGINPKVLDVVKNDSAHVTHLVRGDFVVTICDQELHEKTSEGYEALGRRVADFIEGSINNVRKDMLSAAYGGTLEGKTRASYETLLRHLEKHPDNMAGRITKKGGYEILTKEALRSMLGVGIAEKYVLGRTQYIDEIQKLETKKKDSGLNAVETGTLAHLKIMDKTEQLRLAYGGTRSIDVQKALEDLQKMHPSRHLRPCPPQFKFNINTPNYTPGKDIQSESRVHRSWQGGVKVHEMDMAMANIEKRVMSHLNEKHRKKWLEGFWGDVTVIDEAHFVKGVQVDGEEIEPDDPRFDALVKAAGLGPDEKKRLEFREEFRRKYGYDGARRVGELPLPEEKAHLRYKPETDFVDKPEDIDDIEPGKTYYVGTSIPEGVEMDYNKEPMDWGSGHIVVRKNGMITHVDIETMSPSDMPRWACPGDEPDLGAMSIHEAAEVPKDAWDKLGGAPKKAKVLDTWDLAMKKPK